MPINHRPADPQDPEIVSAHMPVCVTTYVTLRRTIAVRKRVPRLQVNVTFKMS